MLIFTRINTIASLLLCLLSWNHVVYSVVNKVETIGSGIKENNTKNTTILIDNNNTNKNHVLNGFTNTNTKLQETNRRDNGPIVSKPLHENVLIAEQSSPLDTYTLLTLDDKNINRNNAPLPIYGVPFNENTQNTIIYSLPPAERPPPPQENYPIYNLPNFSPPSLPPPKYGLPFVQRPIQPFRSQLVRHPQIQKFRYMPKHHHPHYNTQTNYKIKSPHQLPSSPNNKMMFINGQKTPFIGFGKNNFHDLRKKPSSSTHHFINSRVVPTAVSNLITLNHNSNNNAPPTPPDIKYDGWQPIPGLVSRPLPTAYNNLNEDITNINDNNNNNNNPIKGLSDSYGVPLNSVTGLGEPQHQYTATDDLHLALQLPNTPQQQDDLAVVKSIGYELYANQNKYQIPPSPIVSQYSFTGPYTPNHPSYQYPPSNLGLIPPLDNNIQYGPPLPPPPPPPPILLNALKVNPPKQPVVFRDPVPSGLIEAVGRHTAHKDAHGIIDTNPILTNGPQYIPPPVPDISLSLLQQRQQQQHGKSLQFQSLIYGPSSSSSHDLTNTNSVTNNNNYDTIAHQSTLNNAYTIPSNTIQTHYHHTPDCNLHKTQQLVLVPTSTILNDDNNNNDNTNNNNQSTSTSTRVLNSIVEGPNEISLQSKLDGYALEIQSPYSKDAVDNPIAQVPSSSSSSSHHTHILNDGLLQSILSAIEHPEYHQILQPTTTTTTTSSDTEEAQSSIVNQLIDDNYNNLVNTTQTNQDPNQITGNEIALYFSNADMGGNDIAIVTSSLQPDDTTDNQIVFRNGQQYGRYILINNSNNTQNHFK